MAQVPEISIIGPGKVGTALGVLARRAGLRVAAIAGRSAAGAAQAAKALGGAKACSPAEAAATAPLVLLTVPDDAIAGVCADLAAKKAFRREAVVAHCSGALASGVLAPARESCGCRVGSMHPLQTFPTPEAAVDRLPGAYFFIEGDAQAAEVLEALATAIGGRCVRIAPEAKSLYHAAAVMACNYLAALLDGAAALAERAGIERRTELSAIEPLVRATIDNVFTLGPAGALTGPIERGDVETLRRHISAMRGCDENLRVAFAAMGKLTVDLALKKGSISAATAQKFKTLLSE